MTVAHPGPRPAAFVFPFEEARVALDAIERLLDELNRCGTEHDTATAEVVVGFEGASRRAFEAWMRDTLDDLRTLRRQLDDDAQELERQIGVAVQRHRDREQAIRNWDRQMAAYRDFQRAQAQLSGLR